MENRDRDKVNNKEPTEADDTARKKPDAGFVPKIERSDLWDSEPGRRREGGRLGDGMSDVGRTGMTSHSDH